MQNEIFMWLELIDKLHIWNSFMCLFDQEFDQEFASDRGLKINSSLKFGHLNAVPIVFSS